MRCSEQAKILLEQYSSKRDLGICWRGGRTATLHIGTHGNPPIELRLEEQGWDCSLSCGVVANAVSKLSVYRSVLNKAHEIGRQ